MKTKLSVVLIALTFLACGGDSNKTSQETEAAEKTVVCSDLYNAKSLKNLFKEATEIKETRARDNYCSYTFTLNKEKHYTHLSIGGLGFANVAMLEQSVSVFTKVEPIEGVGEKAYMTTSGQISALSDKNLIHVSVSASSPDKERSKRLATEMLNRLK